MMRAVINHITDVMLTKEQLTFYELLFDKYKANLSRFDEYVVQQVQNLVDKIVRHVLSCGLFVNKHIVAPPVGQVPPPAGYLDTRLQALESGLLRVKQRCAVLAPPLSITTTSMNNFGTPHWEVYSPSFHPWDFRIQAAHETWVRPLPVFQLVSSSSSYCDILRWKRFKRIERKSG